MIKIILLLALVGIAVVSASDYESLPYYSNHYAPIYSINSNPQKGNNNHNNRQNNNIIRNSYYSSYGYKDDGYGYGKGSPYYSSNYYSCVQNNNNNQNRRNRQGLGNLAGLLGGCSNVGGNLGGI